MKKLFLIAFVALLLSGCSLLNQQIPANFNTNPPAVNVSQTTPTNGINIVKNSEKCFLSNDCEVGFHCFNKKCISNEILKNKEDCKIINQPPVYHADCTQKCENCTDGEFKCWGGSTEISDIKNKCVECTSDYDCKSGFTCDEYRCVKVEETCIELKGKYCSSSKACIGGRMFRAIDTDYCCTGSCG